MEFNISDLFLFLGCDRKFTKFNVTFTDTSWLPPTVTLSQL